MKIELLGGFGEKGRTSLAVSGGRRRILLDAGIRVGAVGDDYYPLLGPNFDAVLISHAHEDHVGALSRLLALGYRGPIFMTRETRDEAPATLEAYADQRDLAAHPLPVDRIEVFTPGDSVRLGRMDISTGCSGHVVGGVWFAVSDGRSRIVYSGDVVPDSPVFRMDTPPECDLLVLDASYGADPVPGAERSAEIATWVAARTGGCLLPTPLSGRSLELLAALPAPIFMHAGMRAALSAQIAAGNVLNPGAADVLGHKLASAVDWKESQDLPPGPLLCDDGMGAAGPSCRLIPRARDAGYPILLTGHLPAGSPGDMAYREGAADWIRMPTHPTLPGNMAIWERAGRPAALGHSCPPADLQALRRHIPTLRTDLVTGRSFEVGEAL